MKLWACTREYSGSKKWPSCAGILVCGFLANAAQLSCGDLDVLLPISSITMGLIDSRGTTESVFSLSFLEKYIIIAEDSKTYKRAFQLSKSFGIIWVSDIPQPPVCICRTDNSRFYTAGFIPYATARFPYFHNGTTQGFICDVYRISALVKLVLSFRRYDLLMPNVAQDWACIRR